MKVYPLPSNENYPGPKIFNVSGLSVESINRNGHIFTLHLKIMMSDPLDFQHDTNPKGCILWGIRKLTTYIAFFFFSFIN